MRYSIFFKWKYLKIFLLTGALTGFLFTWTCSKSVQSKKNEINITEKPEQLKSDEDSQSSQSDVLTSFESYTIECGGQEIDLEVPLNEIATALEADSLLYDIKPLTDCSGIFHRVLKAMKRRCPDQNYPSVKEYRDSRNLARWYHECGELMLIENALDNANLIKPGAVLFFGQRNAVYKDFTVEDLLIPKVGINHVGVVVKVHKNESGDVISYELFHGHGRKGQTPASTTNWHKREPTRSNYPPFGNGKEQWVAFARLLSPVKK